jgi:hypothetical protein
MAKRLKTYRIDGDLDDAAAAKAARIGCTVTDVIVRAIEEFVKDEPPQRVHGITIITDERMPPGTAALVSRGRDAVSVEPFSLGAEDAQPERSRKPAGKGPCEHRVQPGAWCKRCGHLI